MARYLMSVWHDEEYVVDFSGEEMQRIGAQVGALNQALTEAGAMVIGAGLMPASTASVWRLDEGRVTSRSGPYASSGPQMGGFWIIEANSPEAATAWAKRAAAACEIPVELRPFQTEEPDIAPGNEPVTLD